jgi:protein-S-isoprenylcysteine O-methyltransferase Ste14
MGQSRLWFSAAGTLLFLFGIWLGWLLDITWSNAVGSWRLVAAILAMVGGLLLYWAQRRHTPRFGGGRRGNTLGDLLLFRWVARSSPTGS